MFIWVWVVGSVVMVVHVGCCFGLWWWLLFGFGLFGLVWALGCLVVLVCCVFGGMVVLCVAMACVGVLV